MDPAANPDFLILARYASRYAQGGVVRNQFSAGGPAALREGPRPDAAAAACTVTLT